MSEAPSSSNRPLQRVESERPPVAASPALPFDEEARLSALHAYQILDTPPEEAFDEIVALASRICDAPIALLSLVDRERQWFKAAVGLDARETTRSASFCAHAILGDGPMVVPDARRDPRFAANPFVTGEPRVRFYAGAPIFSREGFALGTLCVIDPEPRELTPLQLDALEILGRQIEARLELAARARELVRHEARLRDEALAQRDRANVERDRFFDLSIDPMCIATLDGRFERVNAAFERVLGWTSAELTSRPYLDFVHPEDAPATAAEAARLAEGGSPSVRFANRYRTRRGAYRHLAWTTVTVLGEGRIYAIARDETDRMSLESQLRHAQKMDALGRLAGGIAHDFNNVLSVILGYADLGRDLLAPDHPLRADLDEIQGAGRRATELVRQLLSFSRQQPVDVQVLDPCRVVTGIEKMLRRVLGADVQLVVLLADHPRPIRGDRGHLEQVLTNLAVNARDAMPGGGTLTVEVANVDLDEEYARLHHDVEAGPHVVLAVTDTGVGMTPDVQSRIFEPFFTTKDPGKGTGLGLATVFGIVRQAGGHVWVYSEPGRGTSFRVYFPAAGGSVPRERAAVPEQEPARGSETVLIVEDDDEVRELGRTVLLRQGYRVLDASNAGEALLIVEQHPADIHLLVTDAVMPRMSGRHLADRLRALRPGIRVLFMSGYTAGAGERIGVLDASGRYLQKPLTPDALARSVRAALDE